MSTALLHPAEPRDLGAVVALVTRCGMPSAGISDQFPAGFVVGRADGTVVACAGLERHGASGLLRSVAVDPPLRGRGFGGALVANRLAFARSVGLSAVYLLTTAAGPYFELLGFRPTQREAVPSPLAASSEFASVCRASAACMVFEFSRLALRHV